MFRSRSPIVLLILLLAAGPLAEAICGAWCGDDGISAACHDVAFAATARLQAPHACGAPIVVSTLPQQQGERAVNGTPCEVPPSVYVFSRSGDQDRSRLEDRFAPFDRQPLSTHLRI